MGRDCLVEMAWQDDFRMGGCDFLWKGLAEGKPGFNHPTRPISGKNLRDIPHEHRVFGCI